jgi:hypothetical protein
MKIFFYLSIWIGIFEIKAIYAFVSMERINYCTGSNKSMQVELCKLEKNKFSAVIDVCKPINKIVVRKLYQKCV